jgi:deoxyribonuclease-4
MSIAGGYYKAVEAAAKLKMDCVQIFTKNNNQWRAKPLSDEDVERFRAALEETGISSPCAHDSYLINLASPRDDLWRKSLDAFVIELERAERLGLVGLVMHPGSYVTSSEGEGLGRIVQAIDVAIEKTRGFATEIWLETTAGQGTNLGFKFEHLQYIIDQTAQNDRLGVCVDTCHILAAGYPISAPEDYAATMDEFDRTVGIDRIRAFHLNDSKRDLGSRVDRHEHIGEGFVGREAFRHILTDPRLAHLPMYMETPKGQRDGKELDSINLAKLRRLMKPRSRSTRSKGR